MCGIRSSKYQWVYFLAIPICGWVAAMIAYNWINWREKSDISGASDDQSQTSPPIPEAEHALDLEAYKSRIAELETALSEAKSQFRDLETTRGDEWIATSELLASILDADTGDLNPQEDIAKRVLTRMHDVENGGGIVEMYRGLMELGASGETGARKLCDALRNPAMPANNRTTLLGFAALFPYSNCMDLFVNIPPDIASQENFNLKDYLEILSTTIELMSASDASIYAARFEAVARNVIAEEPENVGVWRMLGVLAFVHNRGSVRGLFEDATQQRVHVNMMLHAAAAAHNDEARKYVESVARNRPNDPVARVRAEQILLEW